MAGNDLSVNSKLGTKIEDGNGICELTTEKNSIAW